MIEVMKESDVIKYNWGSYTSSIIFGKGPTFKVIPIEDLQDKFVVCVNDTINYIDKCDLLVCNDIESFDKIDLTQLAKCKLILIPYHIHKSCKPHHTITYKNVIDMINEYYNSNIIVYNLKSINKKYPEMSSLDSAITSSHTAYEFISKYIPQINSTICYGVCRTGNATITFYKGEEKSINTEHFNRYKLFMNELGQISKRYNRTISLQ